MEVPSRHVKTVCCSISRVTSERPPCLPLQPLTATCNQNTPSNSSRRRKMHWPWWVPRAFEAGRAGWAATAACQAWAFSGWECGFVAGFVSRLLIWLFADRKRARREEMLRAFLLLSKCFGVRCETVCRMLQSLCPLQRLLCGDTWEHAKSSSFGLWPVGKHDKYSWVHKPSCQFFSGNVYDLPKRLKRELCIAPTKVYSYMNLEPFSISA